MHGLTAKRDTNSLKLTNCTKENGCLEDFLVSFWGPDRPIFRGELLAGLWFQTFFGEDAPILTNIFRGPP